MYKKYRAQKRPKICTGCRVSAGKIYLYHCTKIAKAWPHRVEWQTDSSVQKQWFMLNLRRYFDLDPQQKVPNYSLEQKIGISCLLKRAVNSNFLLRGVIWHFLVAMGPK